MSPPPPVDGGEDVRAALAGAGRAFAAAVEAARRDLAALGPPPRPVGAVVAGGARTGPACEGLAAALSSSSPVPVLAADNDRLAAHVGAGWLVAVCWHGDRERRAAGALAAAAEARGASTLLVGPGGAVTTAAGCSGAAGPIATAPLVEFLPALVAVAEGTGLVRAGTAAEGVEALVAAAGTGGGDPAAPEALARRIGRTIPLFEGASGIGAAAARSWRRSWNLLAKAPAIAAAEPGASFEEVCGFGQHGDVTRQLVTLVSLRTAADAAEDRARSELLAELVGEAVAGAVCVEVPGEGTLGPLARLEWVGLATAEARAAQEGLDPGPIPAADDLEARLV